MPYQVKECFFLKYYDKISSRTIKVYISIQYFDGLKWIELVNGPKFEWKITPRIYFRLILLQ